MTRRRGVGWLLRSRNEIESDVDEEISFHLDMRIEALERSGLSRADAEARARHEFGDVTALRASLRRHDLGRQQRARAAVWLGDLKQDVRFAFRSLRRAPAFAAAALGTLAVATGATIATFAVLNAVVLRPLPYDAPDRLVSVRYGGVANITVAEEMERRVPAFSAVTGIAQWGLTLTGVDDAVEIEAQVVEPAFFDMLSVRPALGRLFREDERSLDRSDVVVLSHALWRDRFGAEPGIIGRRLQLDGHGHRSREVIGVLPAGFLPPLADGDVIDAWIPLRDVHGRTAASDSTWYLNAIIARLHDGATLDGAAAGVRGTMQSLRAETGVISDEALASSGAALLLDEMVGESRRTLWLLLGAVSLVLALACANLANLMLARGSRRRNELAARAALGASRGRLLRELLTECSVLGVTGTLLGLGLARALLDLLRVTEISRLPRMAHLSFDARVIAFAVTAMIVSVLLFGVVPALRNSAAGLRSAAGTGSRTRGHSIGARRSGRALIGAEVALAMVLTTSAALLISSFRTLRSVDSGLRAEDVLTARISPAGSAYQDERATQFYEELEERVRALPGVRSAGAIQLLPFSQGNWSFPYLAQGHEPPVDAPLPTANFRVVTPGYFAAVDMPVLAGRAFDMRDTGEADAVGIINRALAEELWPGEDAVGREILLFGNVAMRIVGVVGDVRQHGLEQTPRPEIYRPHAQWRVPTMQLMIEHDGNFASLESALRTIVRELDPAIPVAGVRPLAHVIDDSLAQRRFVMRVLTAFGFIALVLGAIGVYGVMSYTASARVPEYGIRIALGATAAAVERSAFMEGMRPVLSGVAGGAIASLATGRALRALLYETAPNDPRMITAAAIVLILTGALASWLPARRFSRVEPMRVLGSQ